MICCQSGSYCCVLLLLLLLTKLISCSQHFNLPVQILSFFFTNTPTNYILTAGFVQLMVLTTIMLIE